MSDRIVIAVAGIPKPKGSMRHVGRGHMIEDNPGSKQWRQTVTYAARQVMRGRDPMAGPVAVAAVASMPRLKRHRPWPITRSSYDVDKTARNLLDAMTGVVYGDDSQVVDLHVTKVYAGLAELPGVRIEVRRVE